MKTLLAFSLFMAFNAIGQMNFKTINDYQFLVQSEMLHGSPTYYEQHLIRTIKGTDVKQVVRTSKYGKKEYVNTFKFNGANRPTEISKGKYHVKLFYENDTILKRVETNAKNGTTEITYSYINGKPVLVESFKDDRLRARTIRQYDADGQLLFSQIMDSKDRKNYSMYYTYNDNHKLVSQRYMHKNKIVSVWNYTCSEEGEKVTPTYVATVCQYKEENRDGSYINYTRKETAGRIYLTKTYYNQDSIFIKNERFVDDTIRIELTEKAGATYKTQLFSEKGKLTRQSTTSYDENDRIINIQTSWKGSPKRVSEIAYEYSEEGLITSEEAKYKGKQTRKVRYEYSL